jgi:hypothetical protein
MKMLRMFLNLGGVEGRSFGLNDGRDAARVRAGKEREGSSGLAWDVPVAHGFGGAESGGRRCVDVVGVVVCSDGSVAVGGGADDVMRAVAGASEARGEAGKQRAEVDPLGNRVSLRSRVPVFATEDTEDAETRQAQGDNFSKALVTFEGLAIERLERGFSEDLPCAKKSGRRDLGSESRHHGRMQRALRPECAESAQTKAGGGQP